MFEPAVRRVGAMTVAYVAMRGPYDQIPAAMGKLYGWVSAHDWDPIGMPMGVYLTDPETTSEDSAIWELWAPVDGVLADEGPDERGLGVKQVPSETVASVMHRGPYEQIGPVYEALMTWVAEHGYAPAGPPREAYLNDPAEVPPADYLTELQVPVAAVM